MKYAVWKACGGWTELWHREVRSLKLPHTETISCTCGCKHDVTIDVEDSEARLFTFCECGHNIEVYLIPYAKEAQK